MILAAFFLAITAQPAPSCAALAPRLTPALRRSEATRLATLSGQRVRPADVSYVLNEGPWRLVFATPRDHERGVFVLRQNGRSYRLIETWGGVMDPEEAGQAAAWARGLSNGGVPARLAACMDRAIIAGR